MATGEPLGVDEKVNEDYLFFLEYFKESFDGLKSEAEKEICNKWLTKLTNESYDTTAEKQARNIYLSQLILNMDERKLSAPFTSAPSSHPLSLDGVFKHITAKPCVELENERTVNENKENWTKFVHNRELEMVDMNHVSNDSRTYIAIQSLPAAGGMFAYVAVTMEGSTACGWVNACGQRISPPVVKPLDLRVEMSNDQAEPELEDKAYRITAEVRSILSQRKTPEARMLAYQFFKRVYSSIEQEMLGEQDPNSTACRDPYVEKLLDKLIEDSSNTCEKFNPNLFKRIKLLSMLKRKVKNILQDIEVRDKKIAKIEFDATSPLFTLTTPASTCSNAMTEMLWQGTLIDKPTSKVAETLAKTYPVCLVKMLFALLARERRKIINRLQEKHEKLIVAMKRDLQNEIKQGIMDYKVARLEWVNVMRIVVHYNRLKAALTEKDIGGTSDSTKSDYLQETIRKEIEDTRKRLNKANKKIEMLQDDICELNKNLHEVTEKMELEQLQAAEQLREFHSEVCSEQASILERTKMIEDLEKMWKESKK